MAAGSVVKRRAIYGAALLALALLWLGFLFVPNASPAQTTAGRGLQRSVIVHRLVNLGFSPDQASRAVGNLSQERLSVLAGTLGDARGLAVLPVLLSVLTGIGLFATLMFVF